eukprot:NODE_323_length_10965_cov_0.441561.p4 type:complete len:316 gc:universal NODE_323_length_10965_cov_0.441561:4494-5441(+)
MTQADWKSENIPNLKGKVVVVTGANSGIGYQTALELARKEATVWMGCRDEKRAETAIALLKLSVPNADIIFGKLDLSDLSSIKEFAKLVSAKSSKIDILINNAGIMALPERTLTKDGFEMQMGTNHMGHYALTGLLMPLILKSDKARIVNVSSSAQQFGAKYDFDNFDYSKGGYGAWRAYGNSKLANMLFSLSLQQKIESEKLNIIVTSCHPGYTATNLQYTGPQAKEGTFYARVIGFMNYIFGQSEAMGALPTLYAAISDKVEKNGYYGPKGFMEMRGYPKAVKPSKLALDEEMASKLWNYSEKKTGVKYVFKQ